MTKPKVVISRKIDGKAHTFTLTPKEVFKAFLAQQHLYDLSSVEDAYRSEFANCSVKWSPEVAERAAKFYRKFRNEDRGWYGDAKEAVAVIVYLIGQEKMLAEQSMTDREGKEACRCGN